VRAELLEVDDPRWTDFLATTRHDFYHLPAYVALSARHESGEAVAILVSDGGRELLQPIVIRPIPAGGHDSTTPYGYPGPLVRGGDQDERFLGAALTTGVEALRARGIVSLFIRLHPILNRVLPVGVGQLRRGGDTVGIDLTLPDDAQWQQVRGNHRIHINRARRNGRVVRFDDEWAHAGDFQRLYRGTMARVSATGYYFFTEDYFADLRAALGDRARLCVVEADGTVAAAGLFVETCGIVQYHLSGSAPALAREGLTKLMIDYVRRWATARRDDELHLGGGLAGTDDPLFHFKAGFSDRRHSFHTLRVVVDEAAYARLVSATGSGRVRVPDAGPGVEAGPDLGQSTAEYFPAYRAARPAPGLEQAAGRRLRTRPVRADDAEVLGELLVSIDVTHFRPHPMTPEEARHIAELDGRDVYLIGFDDDDQAVAYGMLRGWDEGYPTASVGVAVRRTREREGIGRAMMEALHDAARARGADSVRLRVHPDNHSARRLYERLGYQPVGMERGEILMLLDFSPV
jgi:ribosomal protein S18 acetylase RimI-like enzyme